MLTEVDRLYRRNRNSVTDVTEVSRNGIHSPRKANLPRNNAAGFELTSNVTSSDNSEQLEPNASQRDRCDGAGRAGESTTAKKSSQN